MLGRKPARSAARSAPVVATAASSGGRSTAKKRKWQEEDSDDSDAEAQITKDDLEAWRKTMAEEERLEQQERERQEREAKRREELQRQTEKAEQRQREEQEAQAIREAEEARKKAEEEEAEQRKLEAATSFVGAGPNPMDSPGTLPAGVRPGKEHLYKTSFCKRWEQGNCNFGAACHFAHGDRELRGRPPKGSAAGTLSVPADQATKIAETQRLRQVLAATAGAAAPSGGSTPAQGPAAFAMMQPGDWSAEWSTEWQSDWQPSLPPGGTAGPATPSSPVTIAPPLGAVPASMRQASFPHGQVNPGMQQAAMMMNTLFTAQPKAPPIGASAALSGSGEATDLGAPMY